MGLQNVDALLIPPPLQSIASLAKKVADREQDRELLCRDLEEIDQLRAVLLDRVSSGSNVELVGRIQIFLVQVERIAELETMIQCQLARLEQSSQREIASRSGAKDGYGDGQVASGSIVAKNRADWCQRLREQ